MTRTAISDLPLAACLLIASCGGGTHDGTPIAPGTFNEAASSEINAGNALLVARIANLAVIRYLAYRDLTAIIYERALGLNPVPATAACGGAGDGQLTIATLSQSAFNVTLQGCRASSDVLLNSGVVPIDTFTRAADGSSASFNTTPNAIQITDTSGTSTVSGAISYHRALANTTSVVGQSEAHTGQLDYTQGGKTDRYRNIAITMGQTSSAAPASVAVAISKLEITTPRVPVSTLLVLTPGPLTLGTSTTTAPTDILLATSTFDGSLVQVDYIGTTSFRLRSFDNHGTPVLDVVKNNSDPDVIAADAAAAN